MIDQNSIIEPVAAKVKQEFLNDPTGHDWWHVYRVWQLSKQIATMEGVTSNLIELGALLHDVADWKLIDRSGVSTQVVLLRWIDVSEIGQSNFDALVQLIDQVSFKGAGVETKPTTIEAQIVQDADRLDAIGAMGIARTFAYGGSKGRLIYDPEVQSVMHNSFEEYKKSTAPTINHFYEKLLLLKDLMNTESAKKLAVCRHQFMVDFLSQFYAEFEMRC